MNALMNKVMLTSIKINQNSSMDKIAGGVIDLILNIAMYVGAILAIYGVYQLLMAFKDENPDGKIKGVTLTLVGIAIATLRGLLTIVGII